MLHISLSFFFLCVSLTTFQFLRVEKIKLIVERAWSHKFYILTLTLLSLAKSPNQNEFPDLPQKICSI